MVQAEDSGEEAANGRGGRTQPLGTLSDGHCEFGNILRLFNIVLVLTFHTPLQCWEQLLRCWARDWVVVQAQHRHCVPTHVRQHCGPRTVFEWQNKFGNTSSPPTLHWQCWERLLHCEEDQDWQSKLNTGTVSQLIIKRNSRAPIYCTRCEHRVLYNNTNDTHAHAHTHLSDEGIDIAVKNSGVLCPLCEQSVLYLFFYLCVCIGWDGGGSVFRSLGGSVYVCLGACLCFSCFCCVFLLLFLFWWGGGGGCCTCVRAYMRACVSEWVRHIYWFSATDTTMCI